MKAEGHRGAQRSERLNQAAASGGSVSLRSLRFAAVVLGIGATGITTSEAAATSDPVAARVAGADPKNGETLFLQCAPCHVSRPGAVPTVGPNLWNIVDRDIGSQAGYAYSPSLADLTGKWDFGMLDRYLRNPKALAPQGRMAFPGIPADRDRADLIAYLRLLSDQPATLPNLPATPLPAETQTQRHDERFQGLPPGPGRAEVFHLCGACHSLMIVKQQGLSRERWAETLVWMTEEQGMQPIEDAALRSRVLDYLSTHYGPD